MILLVLLTGGTTVLWAQQDPLVGTDYWHGVERSLRYRPEGDAFVIRNGERRFNRALYGGHSGLRVEAGDLPEFALYRPRLAGTLRLGILNDGRSQWLIDADSVTASYDPGLMRYLIRDDLLSDAWLELEVLAPQEQEGLLVRFRVNGPPAKVELVWAFGGASDERFSREGDIGADPESVFYLEPAHCQDNLFTVFEQGFTLRYPSRESGQAGAFKTLRGIFPPTSQQKTADAGWQGSPGELWSSTAAEQPLLAGKVALTADWQYGLISAGEGKAPPYLDLAALFARADAQRRVIANRVRVSTPDPFLNNLGGALAIAADAIWEDPAYHHGAIAWRQQLVGWRGAYVADPLGWHDRAHTHFSAYARSQLTEPASGPVVPDTSRNLARQVEEIGTAIFTEGYISRYPGGQRLRAHHYDMNQVYIDALLRHFDWTGDLAFAREMWPVIRRHLAWEKRCFDVDDDGLYDAYCSIWASDAVQYSGGGVTHASSYHYYSNTRAAELAVLLGEDPSPYRAEAARIKAALIEQLWMPEAGCFAEYKDLLGLRLLHRSPAVWTIYHAMDSEVPDPLQAYQMLDHVQREIPRIPIRAKGLPDTNLYTISTTNWLPYTWSVNNVALAEIMHTSLAFWQGGRADEAFLLWKSALMESMYLGASPGSFQQLSFYDAVRGELYRDFADPIAMTARALVEGLFGIRPDLLAGELHVAPGLPTEWDHAELSLPDISLAFERGSDQDRYRLEHRFAQSLTLRMQLRPRRVVDRVMVNGEAAEWRMLPEAVGRPLLDLVAAPASAYVVEVHYLEQDWPQLAASARSVAGQPWSLSAGEPELLDVFDPQGVWTDWAFSGDELAGKLSDQPGERTFFVQLEQHDARWWAPVPVDVLAPIALTTTSGPAADSCYWRVTNNTAERQPYTVRQAMTDGPVLHAGVLPAAGEMETFTLSGCWLKTGTNLLELNVGNDLIINAKYVDWEAAVPASAVFEPIDLMSQFNAAVTDIFTSQYWSPRPPGPTVQLPVTGIGNWCYPNVEVNIDDSGLRALAGADGTVELLPGIPFALAREAGENIVFTSQWDRFPEARTIPLSGRADHLYLLMAGSTNPMQSRLDNGVVEVTYSDGTTSQLLLRNPDNWIPIEQDYYLDGYAFYATQPRPPRVHLKTGLVAREFEDYISIKGFSETGIDGGAATVLDLVLDPSKELISLTVRTLANDVVIGLMAATLIRTP